MEVIEKGVNCRIELDIDKNSVLLWSGTCLSGLDGRL